MGLHNGFVHLGVIMPITGNFSINRQVDCNIAVQMVPPTNIGGWAIQVWISKRFGSSSGIIQAYANSGYNNVSGINILDSGAGIFSFKVPGAVTSGLDPGNYALEVRRTNSGRGVLIENGYMELKT